MRSTSSLQADSVISIGPGMHWGDNNLEPAFSITAANATRLPIARDNLLSLRVSAGWSGSADPARWPEVGGSEGRFRVRGVDDGYMTGSHLLAAGAEYSVQLAAIEQKIGRGSAFIDDLQACVFVDAATASNRLSLDDAIVCVGVEIGVSLVQLLGDRNLISIGLAGPVLRRGTAPEPASKFRIYLTVAGSPL